MPTLTLPDGSTKSLPEGATLLDAAASIGPRLAKDAIAGKLDGKLLDLSHKIEKDAKLEILTTKSPEATEILRHSASHLMAQAITRLFGKAKLWVGPPLNEGRYGFYYDMDLEHRITEDDLRKIEQEMEKIAKEDLKPVRVEMKTEEAIQKMVEADQPYKVELIRGFGVPSVSFYRQGEFLDLCEGPHVPRTGVFGGLKLMAVTGAYLHGDQKQKMLQRVYGCAFFTKKELDAHLKGIEDAEKNDHRRIGTDLDLFFTDPVAPGSPFFLPKGAFLYNALISFMREHYQRLGYQEVITPQVFSSELWKRSGHYDHYRDNMYFCRVGEEEFGMKPMNCPSHALMFRARLRSYRELPLRLADFGRLHRLEASGVLAGLTRVRSLSQDDSHIFCMPDQIEAEIQALLALAFEVYRVFGMELRLELSTRPPKSLGSDEIWAKAEGALRKVLDASGRPYQVKAGEGAFYGPKIDFHAKDALGREWQLATVQLDFNMAERFDLEYVGPDGHRARPVVIHRAILGSLERFLGVLIEHTGGKFPLWLAPEQVRVMTITDKEIPAGEKAAQALRDAGLRVGTDFRGDKINAKIRDASLQRIPCLAILGGREAETGAVSVRDRDRGDLGVLPLQDLAKDLRARIDTRT